MAFRRVLKRERVTVPDNTMTLQHVGDNMIEPPYARYNNIKSIVRQALVNRTIGYTPQDNVRIYTFTDSDIETRLPVRYWRYPSGSRLKYPTIWDFALDEPSRFIDPVHEYRGFDNVDMVDLAIRAWQARTVWKPSDGDILQYFEPDEIILLYNVITYGPR